MHEVFVKGFDKNCSELDSDEFLNLIFSKLKFSYLVVGEDFRFGKQRSGGSASLETWCSKNGVKLLVVSLLESESEKISSTRIKKLLLEGLVEKASKFLGSPYFLEGNTCSDQGLGSKIGFPTLNFRIDAETAIARGVYTSFFVFEGREYKGISNIGFRPTVSDKVDKLTLETHLLDLEVPLVPVGSHVKVELRSFIRGEQKFANIDKLKAQIKVDIGLAKARLY